MEFGDTSKYLVNTIAENLFDQTGDNGWDTGVFSEIIGLRRDDNVAVPRSRETVTSFNGQTRNVITTKGWDVHVKWQGQSTSWLSLNVVKESYPVELADFAYMQTTMNPNQHLSGGFAILLGIGTEWYLGLRLYNIGRVASSLGFKSQELLSRHLDWTKKLETISGRPP